MSATLAAACVGRGSGDTTGPAKNDSTVGAIAQQAKTPITPTCASAVTPTVAATRLNQQVAVAGNVVNVEQGSNGDTIVDMGATYPSADNLSIVIPQGKVSAFPDTPATLYGGKTICVVGVVVTYERRNAIVVGAPDAIAVESPH